MGKLLEIRDLRVSFGTEAGRLEAISGVSLSVSKKKTVCIVGESGCGKTVTALSILKLIPEPPGKIESGEILFDGKNLLTLSESELREIRGGRISMIFQEPISSLNPVFTVGDQIGEAIKAHENISNSAVKDRVIELLKLVQIPIPDQRFKSYPHELSGGMCQRVMIAMALSCNPELLIADEPTTALDVTIQAGILELLEELQERLDMSILLITHDLGIVAEVADEVYVMYAGKIVEHAETVELYTNSKHPYTVGLLNSLPRADQPRKSTLQAIGGVVPALGEYPQGCRFADRCPMVVDKCREEEPMLRDLGRNHSSACHRAEEVEKVARKVT